MYYLFKKDLYGNKVPCFAAEHGHVAMQYAKNTKDEVHGFYADGKTKTILGL